MPDVYATITDVDVATQERLADILECAPPIASSAPCSTRICLRSSSHTERGCSRSGVEPGRSPAPSPSRPGVAEAVGVDPSPVFITRARELADAAASITFEQGDGRSLRFADGDFDAAVVHTTLCHVPQPDRLLTEAFRVLRPDGTLAVCDGDYATITVALSDGDPLQDCIEAVKAAFITDVWLVRRLPALLRSVGFEVLGSKSHGYLQTSDPGYMLTLVDRGADALVSSGRVGPDLRRRR